jgi:carbon storage regulator
MLNLTSRIGETVVIGEDVKITVLAMPGNQVRFGIDAPQFIPMHRKEVFERMQRELAARLSRQSSSVADVRAWRTPTARRADPTSQVTSDSSDSASRTPSAFICAKVCIE